MQGKVCPVKYLKCYGICQRFNFLHLFKYCTDDRLRFLYYMIKTNLQLTVIQTWHGTSCSDDGKEQDLYFSRWPSYQVLEMGLDARGLHHSNGLCSYTVTTADVYSTVCLKVYQWCLLSLLFSPTRVWHIKESLTKKCSKTLLLLNPNYPTPMKNLFSFKIVGSSFGFNGKQNVKQFVHQIHRGH